MQICGLQKLTLIDFPGKLACTVFLAGCNFRCPWCYSSELVLPEKIKSQPKVSEREFFDFLKKRKGLLDAVTICGGEPSLNEDLPDLTKKIKKLNYLIKLDTNGSNPQMMENLIEKKLVDYVAMDIKAPKEKYPEAIGEAGVSPYSLLDNIEKSINILKKGKVDYEFRTTLVPGLLEKEDILKIAKWLAPAKKYLLQNFRPEKTLDPNFETVKPYPIEYLYTIQKAITPFFEICQVRE